MDGTSESRGVSRRGMLKAGSSVAACSLMEALPTAAAPSKGATSGTDLMLELNVNGRAHKMAVDSRMTLLDALREKLGLTGTKKGCDHGQCGACTVLMDGRRVLACLTLAASAEGAPITTIEGLGATDGRLHPMQQAFIDHDSFQCGYCTPGQIMSAVGCVSEGHAGSPAEVREHMSGNLCRCGAYPNIVAAIMDARAKMRSA